MKARILALALLTGCATASIPVIVEGPLPDPLNIPSSMVEQMECDTDELFPSYSAKMFCLMRERIQTLRDIIRSTHD